jgi:hypothetical protein
MAVTGKLTVKQDGRPRNAKKEAKVAKKANKLGNRCRRTVEGQRLLSE